MPVKIIYLVLGLLYFIPACAQQEDAGRLLKNIINLADSLKNDTAIKKPCKTFIQTYSSHLPGLKYIPGDTKSLNRLLPAANTFINSSKEPAFKKCSDKRTADLVDLTTRFVEVLKKRNTQNAESETVKITADSSKKGTVKQLSSADSSNRPVHQPPGAFAQQLATLHSENKALLFSLLLLLFLMAAGVWLYAINYKKTRLLLAHISERIKEPTTNTAMEPVKTEPPQPVPVTPVTEQETTPVIDAVIEKPVVATGSDNYFVCEIMMTAGPRKKPMSEANSDKDLGEDVCGFIVNSNETFVWLLDGTSDDDPLKNPLDNREYFSARLLAQSIGDRLRNTFAGAALQPFTNMVQQAVEEVKESWLQAINALPGEEKTALKNKIANKNFPHCSTTALIAKLDKNGDLAAYRVGDSKMLLFSVSPGDEWSYAETSLAENNENGVDRIFFRLELKEDKSFHIVSNSNLEYNTAEAGGIAAIICFSDGIGAETEQTLKQEYKTDPAKTKREVMREVQGTRDDKSICFIELKKNAAGQPANA